MTKRDLESLTIHQKHFRIILLEGQTQRRVDPTEIFGVDRRMSVSRLVSDRGLSRL